MISKLRKLKGRSFAELADRGRQKVSALAERAGVSSDLKMLADDEFLRVFAGKGLTAAEDLARYCKTRKTIFFPSFDDREATVAAMQACFPIEAISIIETADEICGGYFDLLGHKGVNFGTPVPDWHFEPVSGKRSPMLHWSQIGETDPEKTGDKKIVWELNRHQYFTVLGRAYWLTEDERYTDVFVSHVEDWIENNPPKIGVNWVSGLEIAFRSISWIWAFHFFRDSPRFHADTLLKILKCLYLNGRHLKKHLSTYSSPNTHLTGEALGLYFIGIFLREIDEAANWKESGYRILMEALDFQIRDDGGYVEQTTQYHRYTADFYLNLHILRTVEGLPIDERHERKLRKMLDFLLFVTQPDGRTPLIGDDDGGRLHFLDDRDFTDFRSTLAVGAAVLGDGTSKFAADQGSAELLWLTGPAGIDAFDTLEAEEPAETVKAFEQSGYYVMRDRWTADANYLLIDCGEHGFLNGGHAHADALSFVMSVNGTPVFVDPGTYNYTLDPEARDRFRSSSIHNCLTVDGKSSSVHGGPFSWKTAAVSRLLEWHTDTAGTIFRGTHNGYERLGVRHEREVRFYNGKTTISDFVKTSASHIFEIHLILAPDIDPDVVDHFQVVLRTKAGKRTVLTIDTKLADDLECDGWRIEKTGFSPRYGSLLETKKLLLKIRSDRDFRIVNSFQPEDRPVDAN